MAKTEHTPEEVSDAEIQAAVDAQIMEQLQAAREANQVGEVEMPSIQTIFSEALALVAAATPQTNKNQKSGNPKVSESTASKLLELSFFWHLNNRQTPTFGHLLTSETPRVPTFDPIVPDEIITGEKNATDETA